MSQLSMFKENQNKVHIILDQWSNILSEDAINKALNIYERVERIRQSGVCIYPNSEDVFKVFELLTPIQVKVVILGQDPYYDGNATGVAFACKNQFTPSFKTIWNTIKETTEKQYEGIIDSSLLHLVNQGVFLLNTILTISNNTPLSHKYLEWEKFTARVIYDLSRTRSNIVFMLWGSYARRYKKYIDSSKHLILEHSHPASSSYNNSQWNCNHFIKANEYLKQFNKEPIKWR